MVKYSIQHILGAKKNKVTPLPPNKNKTLRMVEKSKQWGRVRRTMDVYSLLCFSSFRFLAKILIASFFRLLIPIEIENYYVETWCATCISINLSVNMKMSSLNTEFTYYFFFSYNLGIWFFFSSKQKHNCFGKKNLLYLKIKSER